MIDRVTDYARSVVNGDVVAGELHRLACKRHLDDLARQRTDGFAFWWDAEASERVLSFFETLTILEGAEPEPMQLLPFQIFDIGATFGWKNEAGYRRFRRRYKSIARQNGKTMENGGMAAYIAGFSGYKFGRLFCVATKHDQAMLAWKEAAKFIRADDDLAELFDIKEYKSTITATQTDCTIEALSRDRSLDDGFRSIFSSIDELHQHKDNSIYRALYNGTRALLETLVSIITTRGKDLNSFAYEIDTYAVNILRGVADADDFFVDIYATDDDDDYFDSTTWIKANPYLMTTPQGRAALEADARTAQAMGGAELKDFVVKCLNRWVTAPDDGYIDVERWAECGSDRTLDDFRGQSCWVGLDLSSGGDLTTLALEFDDKATGRIYLYSHSFMPRGRLAEHLKTDLAPYDIWEHDGLISVTGGDDDYKNDYKFIVRFLQDLRDEYDLQYMAIGYDPHNADGFLADLNEVCDTLIEVRQSARELDRATVDMRLSIKEGIVEYDKSNALLTWSMVNAKITSNSFGEIKVDKEMRARHRRIDPVDACIDAHTAYLKTRDEDVDHVADYLALMGWSAAPKNDDEEEWTGGDL